MINHDVRKRQSTPVIDGSEQLVLSTGFRNRKWAYVSVIGAGAALSLILTLTALLVSRRHKLQRNPATKPEVIFCCKKDAEMIILDLNRSGNACEDFYEYVCSRAGDADSGFVPPALKVNMAWKLVEFTYMAHGGGVGQRVLQGLRRSLASWIWLTQEEQIADLTYAILNVGNVTAAMNSMEIMRFLASMSLKYGLQSVLGFTAYPLNTNAATTLHLHTYTGCLVDTDLLDVMTLAVRKFNDHTTTTLNRSDMLNFAQKVKDITHKLPESQTQQFNISEVPIPGISAIGWQALLDDFVFATLRGATTISLSGVNRIVHLVKLFSDPSNQPAALAHVTVCTAFYSVGYLRRAIHRRSAQRTELLMCHGLRLCYVDDLAKTEAVWSESLEARIRELFSVVRKKVRQEAIGANVLKGNARSVRTEAHLDKLTLVLPTDIRNAVSNLTVPHMMGFFGLDLLAARGHNFDIKRIHVKLNLPESTALATPKVLRSKNLIYVSNDLCLFLDPYTTRDGIFDLAALGVGLAAEFWSFLLEDAEPESTRQFVETNYLCFRDTYFSGTSGDTTWRRAFLTALGLASAANAGRMEDWSDTFSVNDTVVSKAQLLYLYWVHNQCSTSHGKMHGLAVNLALRNSQLFREAFECTSQSFMGQQPACLLTET
ncbi:hypothetical protein HPB50_026350 [Hyalomma asiaticum]|uniref:Uncharacterized protein n=1 Tax=Hyalomma asiaticum TaxID=266040 RepID=A0ACB7SZC1_HYAAI|nr:hypothetical protein HPB50_026350 [Hyalomma asiaticum]